MFYVPSCQRRSPLSHIVLIASLGFALMALLGRLVHGQEADQRAATVFVKTPNSTGSGVCVDRRGLIVTAAHVVNRPTPPGMFAPRGSVQTAKTVEVKFRDRQPEAARVLAVSLPGEPADLALLQCSGTDYPSVSLAKVSPAVGEPVISMGYPAGLFAMLEGRVTSVGMTTDKSSDVITSKGRPLPGHSGGPLCNARGEVVGICSMGTIDAVSFCGRVELTEQLGMYSRVERIHDLMARHGMLQETGNKSKTKIKKRVKLRIFVKRNCPPCKDLKIDFEAGKIQIEGKQVAALFDCEWIDADQYPELVAAAGVVSFPTIDCAETGDRIEGYVDAGTFAARVRINLGGEDLVELGPPGLFDPLPGERAEPVPPPAAIAPGPAAAPKADPAETPASVDGTGLRVVLLVKKQDLSWWQGTAVAAIEKFAEGGLKNRINSALEGKAEITVVFQRTSPARYAELVQVTGENKERNAMLIVLAPQTFTGVLGTVAKVIESRLAKIEDVDFKHARVETIFERTDPDNYHAVVSALESSEPAPATNDQTLWAWLLSAIGGLIAGGRDAFLGHKAKAGAK